MSILVRVQAYGGKFAGFSSSASWNTKGSGRVTPDHILASPDQSLRQLGTDYVDVFQLHAVSPSAYPYARDAIVPALLKEKDKGKFRHLGTTETPPGNFQYQMLRTALEHDDIRDVVMIGFHMMHQNARTEAFPLTMAKRVGSVVNGGEGKPSIALRHRIR